MRVARSAGCGFESHGAHPAGCLTRSRSSHTARWTPVGAKTPTDAARLACRGIIALTFLLAHPPVLVAGFRLLPSELPPDNPHDQYDEGQTPDSHAQGLQTTEASRLGGSRRGIALRPLFPAARLLIEVPRGGVDGGEVRGEAEVAVAVPDGDVTHHGSLGTPRCFVQGEHH